MAKSTGCPRVASITDEGDAGNRSFFNHEVFQMKNILAKIIKSKWSFVIGLALVGLVTGSTYGDQIIQAILLVLGQ